MKLSHCCITVPILFALLGGCEAAGVSDTTRDLCPVREQVVDGDLPDSFEHGDGVPRRSPGIIAWATGLGLGGYQPGEGADIYTDPRCAFGPVSGISTDVLVLGDGGRVTLSFARPIQNTPGQADFAVYENGIANTSAGTVFAELAWVAVASRVNATDAEFARFPATTTRTTPVGSWEQINPDDYSGFAGIHPAGTGTAFDLSQLSDHQLVQEGIVDLNAIRYVRIIDVIGDGNQMDDSDPPLPIYDPYPTYNPSITNNTAGFDLDGIAVLGGP